MSDPVGTLVWVLHNPERVYEYVGGAEWRVHLERGLVTVAIFALLLAVVCVVALLLRGGRW